MAEANNMRDESLVNANLPISDDAVSMGDLQPHVVLEVARVETLAHVYSQHGFQEIAQYCRVGLGEQVLLDHDALEGPGLQCTDATQGA